MLLASPRRRAQQGQALLLILVFVAAFPVMVWAGATLAASSFLDLTSVQADTRTTEALDAGLAFGMEQFGGIPCSGNCQNGNGNGNGGNGNNVTCPPVIPGALVLPYTKGAITVNVQVTASACGGANPTVTFHVSSPSTKHTLDALVTQGNTAMVITWERFQ